MTTNERLAIYKKALRDWKIARWVPYFIRCIFISKIGHGFCYYFYDAKIDIYQDLPELANQRPGKSINMWYPSGQTKPRIAALQRAIVETEEKIKWEAEINQVLNYSYEQ